ncbi:flagellar basal body-associated protein FliL [uncultured Shimia sp.]|uniref:flagellar basal body-associated protein FliL n=1 Tax=uncultured Shimia sp. TaxID=573152 RepID=UPI00262578D7|nr:flagellar basal body-associated protein FliL [uncultured Shimia sp.]
MKKLLPIILLLVGIGAGVGAGLALRPEPAPVELTEGAESADHAEKSDKKDEEDGPPSGREYVDLVDQFIVPVVNDDAVASLILITLTIEVESGNREAIFEAEPRLRGALLQTMFDHANIGGFNGAFTNSSKLDRLRETFLEVAQKAFGDEITDVLIVQITRQDIA